LLHNPAANDGRPIELRQAINDTRGEISELLSKAINRGALDEDLSAHDKERMLAFLQHYGDLSPDLRYEGSTRSGYKTLPGPAEETGVRRDPVPLGVLLDADMWTAMLFEENFAQQATMFQPVGGMDRIAEAFAKKLGAVVRLGSEVTAIRRTNNGVSISFVDKQVGRHNAIEAAYCIVTIPLTVLRGIECDFSPAYRAAIRDVDYGNAVKIAWQSRRFWEADEHIYGGISWTARPTTVVWYPSDGFFSPKGILLGGYAIGGQADELASRPLREQFDMSRAAVEGLHPGRSRELEKPMAVAWSKVPYSLGFAARFRNGQESEYSLLNTPDGPFYFAGEHLSRIGPWQEGAILSARRAANMIDKRRRVTDVINP
jgi:monoamine oxidase